MGEKLKHEIKEIVEIESRLRRGKDYEIIIPNKVFERLNKIYKTDIFKLLIENDVNKVHYWKYNPHREQQISSKEFKEGKYRVSIEPYNVLKFIREFNEKVRGKLKVELSLEQNKIALKIGETTLFSKEWSFDKEHGGGISIKASFPSITRAERKIILKFQLKNEEAKIWIVERRKSGFRPAIYLIERLFSKYGSIVAVYRHGKRQKITLITSEVKLDYKDAVEKTFEYLSITETRQVRIGDKQLLSYSYNITSEDTSDMLDYLMRLSYMLIKTQEYSTLGREIRDKIGKYITAMFLSKIGLKEIYVDPLSTPKFRFLSSIYKVREPDVFLIDENYNLYIVEVKFRFHEEDIRNAFDIASSQVKDYYDIIKNSYEAKRFLGNMKLRGKIITIVTYHHRCKCGYILIWRENYGNKRRI